MSDKSKKTTKSAKRSYRKRVKCDICQKEMDSDYREKHAKTKHRVINVVTFSDVVEKRQRKIVINVGTVSSSSSRTSQPHTNETAIEGEDVETAIEGEDVETAIEGEDVETAIEGEDVETAIEGEDVETAIEGEDVGTASHNLPSYSFIETSTQSSGDELIEIDKNLSDVYMSTAESSQEEGPSQLTRSSENMMTFNCQVRKTRTRYRSVT